MSSAPTGHVVTTEVQLHDGVTAWTRLPPFTFRECLERFIRCDTAFFTWVSRFLALRTGICIAMGTFNPGKR